MITRQYMKHGFDNNHASSTSSDLWTKHRGGELVLHQKRSAAILRPSLSSFECCFVQTILKKYLWDTCKSVSALSKWDRIRVEVIGGKSCCCQWRERKEAPKCLDLP